jgi:hypothetical protein
MARRETALRREIEDALLLTERWRDEVDKKTIHETFCENAQTVGSVKPDESNEIEKLKDNAREMARRETALRREIEDALLLTERWRDEVDKKTIHETFSENAQTVGSVKPDESNEIEKLKDNAREMARRERALRQEVEDACSSTAFCRTQLDSLGWDKGQLVSGVEEGAFVLVRPLQWSFQNLGANALVERSLRAQVEELILAELGTVAVAQAFCDDVSRSEHALSTASGVANGSGTLYAEQQIEKCTESGYEENSYSLRFHLKCKCAQLQTRSKVESALRSELEEMLLQDKFVDDDRRRCSDLQSTEQESVTSFESTESFVGFNSRNNERALRSEVEELLIMSDVTTTRLNEAQRYLSNFNDKLITSEKQVEIAVKSNEMLENELHLVKSQLSASQTLAEKAEAYEKLLNDREAEITVLADKLRDFAVRFDEQAAEFQREIRRVRGASVSDQETAELLAEIERLNNLLEQERRRKSHFLTFMTTNQNIEPDLSVKLEDVESLALGSGCTINEVDHPSIDAAHAGNTLKQNRLVEKSLRQEVEELLTNSSDEKSYANTKMEETAKLTNLLGDSHEVELRLREEIEELLMINRCQHCDLRRGESNDSEDFAASDSHSHMLERRKSIQEQQHTERALRLEVEELLMKTRTFSEESVDTLKAVSAINKRFSLERFAQKAQNDETEHKIRQSGATIGDLSVKMIPIVCIESTSSCTDNLNLQIQGLTAELNQKDEKFEEERKRFSNEIEGLRKELASAAKRRVSGIEKTNDLMVAQMELQIALLQERLKEYENLKEDYENLKMENCRLKADVEKERLKGSRRPSTPRETSSDDELTIKQLTASCKAENVDSLQLRATDDRTENNNSDAVFEETSEKLSSIHANDDMSFHKKLPSDIGDLQHENSLLRGEIASLTQELDRQKSIASNMLAPIQPDDDIFTVQINALHAKVKDLTEQKIIIAGNS